MPEIEQRMTCHYCDDEFWGEIIQGSNQCTDGAGYPTCDDCYDDETGYGRYPGGNE